MASGISESLPQGHHVMPQGTLQKEGSLWKRQRGSHIKGQDYSGLKIQKRFIRLDAQFLNYYGGPSDKTSKGKFQVSSIKIIEEVEPGTFSKDLHYFQIGNQKEVMYFGNKSSQICSEWMEALRIAARNSGNKMLSDYHPGAYGNGEWTCCKKKMKDIIGCQKTHSADTAVVTYQEVEKRYRASTLPAVTNTRLRPSDTMSIDSGLECQDSMTSLNTTVSIESLNSISPPPAKLTVEPIEEQDGEYPVWDSLEEMLNQHGYDLQCTRHYGSALTALDFRGTDTLIAAEKSGKVHVLHMYGSEEEQNSQEYDHMHSEVKSLETWRSLLIISGKNELWHLRDLDSQEFQISSSSSQPEKFIAFTPDGARIITANENVLKVKSLLSDSVSTETSKHLELSGTALLLSVSPDPKIPRAVVGIAKNERLILCMYDYTEQNDFMISEIDIGNYDTSHTIQSDFSSSKQKLAIGNGKNLLITKLEKPGSIMFSNRRDDDITSLKYSPIQDQLAVGFTNGNVEVLDGRGNLQHNLDFTSLLAPVAVTSLTYSKDSSLLAFGQSNGVLNVIKKTLTKVKNPVKSSRTITVPSGGDTLRLREHGITIEFPPGFTTQQSMSFDYDVKIPELFGPECFPRGGRPVSAVLELHPHNSIEFEKPIKITMPHFINLETEEDCKNLAIFKACSKDSEIVNGREIWKFNKVLQNESNTTFWPVHHETISSDHDTTERRGQSVTISLKHCCIICIGKYDGDDTRFNNVKFCITRAQKLNSENGEVVLHYCFHFDLDTCKQMVRDQYPKDSYSMQDFPIKLKSETSGIGIEVQDPENLKESGWKYYFEGCNENSKISYRKDINFWGFPSQQLMELCIAKFYPPRYTLRVSASNSISACRSIVLRVKFPGVFYIYENSNDVILTSELKGSCVEIRKPLAGSSEQTNITAKRGSRTESSSSIVVPTLTRRYQSQSRNTRHEALQSVFDCLCEEIEPWAFALKLYSKFLLDDNQMEKISPKSEPRSYEVFKILWVVKDKISEEPEIFETLCTILELLNYNTLVKKLKDALTKLEGSDSICV